MSIIPIPKISRRYWSGVTGEDVIIDDVGFSYDVNMDRAVSRGSGKDYKVVHNDLIPMIWNGR